MQGSVLNSGWQTALVAVPFIAMLMAGVFRLDELLRNPKRSVRRRRSAITIDEDGRPVLCDPDGRPSGPESGRK